MTKDYEEESSQEIDQPTVTPAWRMTFLEDPKKGNLAKVLKKLDKNTEEALDFLVTTLRDEKVDIKERIAAAKFIVEKKIQVSEACNKEILSRQIAESRLILAEQAVRSPKNFVDTDEEDQGGPAIVYAPNVIQDINKCRSL